MFPRRAKRTRSDRGGHGRQRKTTTTRLIAHLVRATGRRVGMTCTEGIYLDDRRLETGDCSGPQSARKLLMNPSVDAVVAETARGGILRAGLTFDRCDVAVVTNMGEGDHLGLNDIETLDKLARVKRVPVEAVGKDGTAVLNAADALVADMAKYCPGKVIFFALDPHNSVIMKHRAAGGRAVFVRDRRCCIGRCRQRNGAGHRRPHPGHARRPHRLPIRKRFGRYGGRLEPECFARSDPQRIGNVRQRFAPCARPFQSAGSQRRRRRGRLRPQRFVV